MGEKIEIEHGSGAKKTRELIKEVFLSRINENSIVEEDAAIIYNGNLAFTTDSFIIDPIFFPGGDIGKLSVCGTANDLAVRGAKPRWMSSSYVISEGFPVDDLQRIVDSMARTAREAKIEIVTGDTKVVNAKDFSGIIINTSGIGEVINPTSITNIQDKDVIIVSGTLGDHSTAILSDREGIYLKNTVESDCAVLYPMLDDIIQSGDCGFIRDMTRGGLTSILYEISIATDLGVDIYEKNIPIKPAVYELSEIMGIDYLGMANEGKVLLTVKEELVDTVLHKLRKSEYGKDACVIGRVTNSHRKILLNKENGTKIELIECTNIPRIC